MLVAQAKTEPLLLLTDDALLAGYGDCIELVSPRPRRGGGGSFLQPGMS